MSKCFDCRETLIVKEGINNVDVQLGDDSVTIRIGTTFFCTECGKYYLTSEQLIDGFVQIKELMGM